MDLDNINIKKLRDDLINYFGTAMFMISPTVVLNIENIENATNEELIDIAINNSFDLSKYKKENIKNVK